MEKHYKTAGLTHRLRQLGLTALLAGGATVAAHAQALNYVPAGTTNTTSTYTDLGTTGTAITTANTDDANSAAQSIGFAFAYNGTSFTQFVLNTNGIIRLGGAAPSTAALYYDNNQARTATDPLQSTNAADINLIMPFNTDLIAGSNAAGADYRVLTSGTAPNRVCTIQWRNVADKPGAGTDAANVTQYANFSFQLKLYETSNNIEFVYGTATASTGVAGFRFPNVGLKGSGNTTGQIDVAVNAANAWTTTTFQSTPYGQASHAITNTVLPDVGRTYRFTPAPPLTDAAVAAIYTLGKLATPASLPHTVQANISNTGTVALTNLIVTLAVTGANTFNNTQTITSLAVGASTTVTFAAYPSTLTVGTNNITVSVPADGNATNNTATYSQQVTANRLLVADPVLTNTSALSYSSMNTGGVLASKFTASTATRLTDAVFYFGATNATTSVQAVVYDATGTSGAPGTLLYTSPAQNRPAAGGPVTITLPNVQVPTSYFIGIKEAGAGGAGLFTQPENPLRVGTFYASANGSTGWTDLNTSIRQVRLLIESGFSAILGTSPELMRAVTVYPNPSADGVFNLAITGANAQKGLEVEVVNTLGQRVYAGTARDNFTTTIDLSNLANGLYHLKVKNGEEYMQRQISVVK